jgi:hypothetical protein
MLDNPLLLAAGIGAIGLGGFTVWHVLSQQGDDVIIYVSQGSGVGEFRSVANRIAERTGAVVYPARNAQEILDAVRQHPRIRTLLLLGHGTTTQFLRPGTAGIRVGADALPTWVSTETFGQELDRRMVRNGIVGWGGCSAASNPGESGWSVASYGPGGEDSFIAHVRDAMVRRRGGASGVEHRGHSAPGHTTASPAGRTCPVSQSQLGQPCTSILDETWGLDAHQEHHNAWVDAFQGLPAEVWIAGGPITTGGLA